MNMMKKPSKLKQNQIIGHAQQIRIRHLPHTEELFAKLRVHSVKISMARPPGTSPADP